MGWTSPVMGCLVGRVGPSSTVQMSTDLVPLVPLSSHSFANLFCQRCSVPRDGAQHQPQPSRLPAASQSHKHVLQRNITPLPGSSCTQSVPRSSEKAEKRLWNQPSISGLKRHALPRKSPFESGPVSHVLSTYLPPVSLDRPQGALPVHSRCSQNASKPFFPI